MSERNDKCASPAALTDEQILRIASESVGVDIDRLGYEHIKFARALLAASPAAPTGAEAVTDNVLIEVGRTYDIHPDSALPFARDILARAAQPPAAAEAEKRDAEQLRDWLLTDPQTGKQLRFAGAPEPEFMGLSRVRMEAVDGSVWTLVAGLKEGYLTASERMANIRAAMSATPPAAGE